MSDQQDENPAKPHPDLPDPATYVSEFSPDTFVGFATVDDIPEADCCPLCAMEAEAIRNGAIVELHEFDPEGFDEEDLLPGEDYGPPTGEVLL